MPAMQLEYKLPYLSFFSSRGHQKEILIVIKESVKRQLKVDWITAISKVKRGKNIEVEAQIGPHLPIRLRKAF